MNYARKKNVTVQEASYNAQVGYSQCTSAVSETCTLE